MSTLQEEISRRRTFAIISHPDAGKTTLTEKFLLYGGAIAQAGEVKGKRERAAKSDWMEKEAEVYKSPRPAAAPPLFQCFFRFPLPWVMVVFPRWLMGLFMCLDSFSTSIKLTNCSIVMAS